MRKYIVSLLILLPSILLAQAINGRIVNSKSAQGIANASIRWIKASTGTTSNDSGYFSLPMSISKADSLEISHVGFAPIRIAANSTELLTKPLIIRIKKINIQISPLIVTATRSETNLLEIPQKITVVDSASLHALPLLNIDDALVFVPGVMTNRPMGIFATKSVVSMRGLPGSEQGRVLVLLDGIPANKSDGGIVNFNLVDPLLTDRIEVVKGPMSALYGGNAMGGVINIISVVPTEKLNATAKLGFGTYNTMSANISLSGFNGKKASRGFFWSAGAFGRSSDGYISEPEYMQSAYTVPVFVTEKMVLLKAGYKFNNKSTIWVSGMLFDDERGEGVKVFEKLGSFSEHDSYHFRAFIKTVAGSWNITSQTYFLRENYAKVNEYMKSGKYTLYDVDSKRTDIGLIAHASRNLGENHNITTGFELRRGAVDAADVFHTSTDKIINAGTMNLAAIFVQDVWRFSNKHWKLVTGLRYDYAGFFGGQFSIENPSVANLYLLNYEMDEMPENHWNSLSPKIAIQYLINNQTRIYSSLSHGFRSPILDDLCRSGKTRGGFQVAQPTLIPENIDNIELGIRKTFFNKLMLEPVFYYSIGRNFMYPVATGDTIDMGYAAPVIVTSNVSQISIFGAELEADYRAGKNLQLFFNYAYAHSIVDSYTPQTVQQIDITGKYLSNVPNHLVNGGFIFHYRNAGVSFNARYVSSRWLNDSNTPDEKYGLPAEYEPYFTADLRLWKSFGKHLLLGFSIVNIADEIYSDSKGQICPGRMAMGELRFTLN